MSNKVPPPAAYRFKPGQSGNPKGRPKGAKNKNKNKRPPYLRGVHPLDEMINYPVDRKIKRMSRSEALAHYAKITSLKERDTHLERLILELDEGVQELADEVDYHRWSKMWSGGSVFKDVDYAERLFNTVGIARLLDGHRRSGRMVFETEIVELALKRLGDERLTREEQKLVVAAVRLAHKINFPAWWEPDLRKHPRNSYAMLEKHEEQWKKQWV